MVSRKGKKAAALNEKLQQLRSVTNSHALSDTSIILDASKYIEDLKRRVETLNQDVASSQNSSYHHHQPMVTVETLEKGFLINVISERNCPGMLVSILEAFDELGLNVVEANFSGADNFHLQATGADDDEESGDNVDAQVVQQVVSQAIKNWIDNNEQD